MDRALVVGGAGYIGSHLVELLLACGWTVAVLDDLSSGHRDAVRGGEFVHGSLSDAGLLRHLFEAHKCDAVLHFASCIQVNESIADPAKYYRNNVAHTLNLLDAMRQAGVRYLVFSSSAAIFGEPRYTPIDESHPKSPLSPYGHSKLMVEQILADYDRAYGLRSVCLRYFNAAGADPNGELGERHEPETHLIPLVLEVAAGRRDRITVFGRDFDTPDGTCIRDYIHVSDLCEAHLFALDYLMQGAPSCAFNLGNGEGFSVNEVIATACAVTHRKIAVEYGARRAGDPACLVADARLARERLGWEPRYSGLDTIIEHAWRWQCRQQIGYATQSTI
jgi:UDP-glucose 4-epimerase